jgi:hypothetical protein
MAFLTGVADRVGPRRHEVKDTILWEIDRGERLTPRAIARAETKRSELYHRMRQFMDRFEFFVLPAVQVPPFDVTQPYVTEIDGVAMETYIDWMKSCYFISIVNTPAISVPCGFTPEGLPVGLQIVARHQDDWGLLQMAHAFEQAGGSSLQAVKDQTFKREARKARREFPELLLCGLCGLCVLPVFVHTLFIRPAHRAAPDWRSAAISSLLKPASRSTSSVCSPSCGARRETSGGVALILIGEPRVLTFPSVGCSVSTTMSRAMTCGSANTCA